MLIIDKILLTALVVLICSMGVIRLTPGEFEDHKLCNISMVLLVITSLFVTVGAVIIKIWKS